MANFSNVHSMSKRLTKPPLPRAPKAPEVDHSRHKQLVGQRLRIARESTGMTQTAFAEEFGLTKDKMNHWERGRNYPAPTFIIRIWERFRIPADWIYLGEVAGVRHEMAESLLAGAREVGEEFPELAPPPAEIERST